MKQIIVTIDDNVIRLNKIDEITYTALIYFKNNIIRVMFEEKREYVGVDDIFLTLKEKVFFDYNYNLNLLSSNDVYEFDKYLNKISCKINYKLEEDKYLFKKYQ